MLMLWMTPWEKIWLKVECWKVLPFGPLILGLHTLTEELGPYAWRSQSESKERFEVALQQMFPTSAETKEDTVKSLSEKYHQYKREYVKHLGFNPKEENLSKTKCILH